MNIIAIAKEIARGKDCYRIFMNLECAHYALRGSIVDLGSGTGSASYHRFFQRTEGTTIQAVDRATMPIDFEYDFLPCPDASIDIILAFNVLEHIYHYPFLIAEIKRVLKPGGRIIGSVPFLVGFHPDPNDYWRYTEEALTKIFRSSGFSHIEVRMLGRGPWIAAFSQMEFMIPRIAKIFFVPFLAALDFIVLKLWPRLDRRKFALGFFFSAIK